DLEGHAGALGVRQGNANDGALAMNTFLAEPMMGRELDFNGDDLSDRRSRENRTIRTPGQEDAAATDVLRRNGTTHPESGRSDMATELDLDSRALAPVDVFHFRGFNRVEFSS